ncbi:FG-GAP repeat domain-containing protein [Kitasatospora sp. NPDC053057]|uniref:FG-GAP repeat domain-containing protein n=1 Tax=Kitasatospora sp. NPDC053057 TaxID=3364062 RepID=UPI0037CB61A1
MQGYSPPVWNAQGQVAPGVQGSGWTDAVGQQIRFAPLFGSGRSDYLFIRPDSSVLGWRNDGPAPGGGITWTSVGLVVPGIQASGYKGPGDGTLSFVDLTGQGRADYVWTKNDGTTLTWLNSGASSAGQPVWVGPFTIFPGSTAAAAGYTGPQSGTLQFADLSGDGWPDLVWTKPDGTVHWWESGHDGLVNHTWTDRGNLASIGAPGGELHFAKATGGARADLLDIRPDSSVVGYGLRDNGSGGLSWGSEGLIAPGVQGVGYTGAGDGDIDFADLSGHGRADYVWVKPDSSALMWQNTAGAGLDDQIRFAPLDTGNTKRADYLDISPLDGSITAWANVGQAAAGGAYTWVPQNTVFAGVPGYQGQGNGSIGNIQLAHVTSPGQIAQDALYIRPDGSVQGWVLLTGNATNVPLGTVVPALKNGYDGTGEIQFADMDGKGTADYLWVHPDSSVSMWQNQYPNWIPKGEIAVGVQASGWTDSPGQHIRFADLTGSGRADYLFIRPDSSVMAWFNPGPSANYAWQPMGQIAAGVQGSGWTAGAPGNTIQFADLNGDGRADYLWVRPDSSVLMWQNTPG